MCHLSVASPPLQCGHVVSCLLLAPRSYIETWIHTRMLGSESLSRVPGHPRPMSSGIQWCAIPPDSSRVSPKYIPRQPAQVRWWPPMGWTAPTSKDPDSSPPSHAVKAVPSGWFSDCGATQKSTWMETGKGSSLTASVTADFET